MTFGSSFLLSLAAELAAELITRGAAYLRNAAFGDVETRALSQAWENAFHAMLVDVAKDLHEDQVHLLEGIFREFVRAEAVAEALLNLALADREPDLVLLRECFNTLGYDTATLQVDFDTTMTALTRGLAHTLLETAMEPESLLYNRVSLVRVAAIHNLLGEQRKTLEKITETVTRLEAQLPAAKYNLVFLGPASGFAIGDEATVKQAADMQPVLESTLAQLNAIATVGPPPPYTGADFDAYLEAVIDECSTIELPYARQGRATIPLEQVYVALRADRSAPVERRASRELFRQLVQEQKAGATFVEEDILYRVARLDPYPARYRIYGPMRERLLKAKREEERPRHLAEIIRRYRWIVLLGDPGSGKSTLARWLALQLARALQAGGAEVIVPGEHVRPDADTGTKEHLGPARLPVLMRIADYAEARWGDEGNQEIRLRDYLGRHTHRLLAADHGIERFQALLRDYLGAGRVTFILDGLDEVTNQYQRQTIAAEIESLIADWVRTTQGQSPLDPGYHSAVTPDESLEGGNQIIVTSRIVGYQIRPLHETLPHFVIQPMADLAVRRFCQNWATANGIPEHADDLAAAVLDHPNPNVKEQMARNPLLLTILAQIYQQDPEAGLPSRRVDLYRRAAGNVFAQRHDHWEALGRTLGDRGLDRTLKRVTAALAFRLHANPDCPASLADERRVRCWLKEILAEEPQLTTGRNLKNAIAELMQAAANLSGFFVAQGEGVYGFLHRQFQEYFAARHLAQLMETQQDSSPFLDRLPDANWREVLLLTIGVVAQSPDKTAQALLEDVVDAPDPTGGMLPHNVLFAAKALHELEHPPVNTVHRVASGLIRAHKLDNEARFEAMRQQVERAFHALPQRTQWQDPVSGAIGKALLCDATGDEGRLTRMAAAMLLVQSKWYTAPVARALTEAWQTYQEPAATLLTAIQAVYDADPTLFSRTPSRFRQAVVQYPALWEPVEAHNHWAIVVRALYLAPWGELTPEAVTRDSPLSAGLLSLINDSPEDEEQLRIWLRQRFTTGEINETARRDAGLALACLGDSAIVPILTATRRKESSLERAVFAASSIGHGFVFAFACDLTSSITRKLHQVFDLAPALARDLARAQDRDVSLEIALAFGLEDGIPAEDDLSDDPQLALDLLRSLHDDLSDAISLAPKHAVEQARKLDLATSINHRLLPPVPVGRLSAKCEEIVELLGRTRERTRDEAVSEEVRCTVNQAATDAQDLEALVTGRHGVLAVRNAIADAEDTRASSVVDLKTTSRIVLDLERLERLTTSLNRTEPPWWRSILPRLDASSMADLQEDSLEEVFDHLAVWVNQSRKNRKDIAHHGALLLAELGRITAQTVPHLCACLQDSHDLTRYRAGLALNRKRSASSVGRETIEQMVHCYRCTVSPVAHRMSCQTTQCEDYCWRRQDGTSNEAEVVRDSLVGVHLDWSLKKIVHNRPDWLHVSSKTGMTDILSRIHRLGAGTQMALMYSLKSSSPLVQVSLLDSLSWLARTKQVDKVSNDWLLALLESEQRNLRCAAVTAAGYAARPSEVIVEHLLDLLPTHPVQPKRDADQEKEESAVCTALARLAVRSPSHDTRDLIVESLRNVLPAKGVSAAWVRLVVEIPGKILGATDPLSSLAKDIPNPPELLTALLGAGTDDDTWSGYHKRIVFWIRRLIERHGTLLEDLLTSLGEALAREPWPPKRIAIAAVAACAEEMPDAINTAIAQSELAPLMVDSALVTDSFTTRDQAITAMGHLRVATPGVVKVLLASAGDTASVQQSAIEAAKRFRHLSRGFTEEEALAPLIGALMGESSAAAYVAAQLLAALGSSPAALEVPALRESIATILADALRNLDKDQGVYLLSEDGQIEYQCSRSQALFEALVQVWGLLE